MWEKAKNAELDTLRPPLSAGLPTDFPLPRLNCWYLISRPRDTRVWGRGEAGEAGVTGEAKRKSVSFGHCRPIRETDSSRFTSQGCSFVSRLPSRSTGVGTSAHLCHLRWYLLIPFPAAQKSCFSACQGVPSLSWQAFRAINEGKVAPRWVLVRRRTPGMREYVGGPPLKIF